MSPEEVLLAVDVAVPDEALLVEGLAAVGALEALGVPVLVQDLQHEAVQDEQPAPDALRDRRWQQETVLKCTTGTARQRKSMDSFDR